MGEKDRLKIAFINIFQNRVNRGAETFVGELTRRLSQRFQVDIISSDSLPPKRWKVLALWRFFLDPQGLFIAWFTLKIIPRLIHERYDVVIPLNGGWQVVVLRVLTWLIGGKIIISGQSGKGWDERWNLWSCPDVFVALSGLAKIWAKRVNPFVKVEYVPNGVDLKKFRSEGEKYYTNLPCPIVLCVGALEKGKRIDLVIKAVAKTNASLLVVGDGVEKIRLKVLAEKLLTGRFEIISLPFNKMPMVYRSVSLFSLVSLPHYSFEIALVEAMASGLGVVANDDSVRREIVGKAGVFVDPTDINAYSESLKKALDYDWGDSPRLQAADFSWDKIADRYEEIIKNLVK